MTDSPDNLYTDLGLDSLNDGVSSVPIEVDYEVLRELHRGNLSTVKREEAIFLVANHHAWKEASAKVALELLVAERTDGATVDERGLAVIESAKDVEEEHGSSGLLTPIQGQMVVPVKEYLLLQKQSERSRVSLRWWRTTTVLMATLCCIVGYKAFQETQRRETASELAAGMSDWTSKLPVYALLQYPEDEGFYYRVPADPKIPTYIAFLADNPVDSQTWTTVRNGSVLSGITCQNNVQWSTPERAGFLIHVADTLDGHLLVRQQSDAKTVLASFVVGRNERVPSATKFIPPESRDEILLTTQSVSGPLLKLKLSCLRVIEGLLIDPDTTTAENVARLVQLNELAHFASKTERRYIWDLLDLGLPDHKITPPDALILSGGTRDNVMEVFPGKFLIEFDEAKSEGAERERWQPKE